MRKDWKGLLVNHSARLRVGCQGAVAPRFRSGGSQVDGLRPEGGFGEALARRPANRSESWVWLVTRLFGDTANLGDLEEFLLCLMAPRIEFTSLICKVRLKILGNYSRK